MATTQNLTREDLAPSNPLVQDATFRLLAQQIGAEAVSKFLDDLSTSQVPAPIGATADVKIAVWGTVHVSPSGQPWVWDSQIWGGPAYFGGSAGFMYTAYATWDAFFTNCTGVHVQGIASAGGILQVNWFNGSTPVGQFNGVAGGVGLLEAGGKGQWKRV